LKIWIESKNHFGDLFQSKTVMICYPMEQKQQVMFFVNKSLLKVHFNNIFFLQFRNTFPSNWSNKKRCFLWYAVSWRRLDSNSTQRDFPSKPKSSGFLPKELDWLPGKKLLHFIGILIISSVITLDKVLFSILFFGSYLLCHGIHWRALSLQPF